MSTQKHQDISVDTLKDIIIASIESDKGVDIVPIELPKDLAIADYIIIASGTSGRHLHGIADKLKVKLKQNDIDDIKIEGLTQSNWVVVDIGDIIVHLFRPEVREFYNIEKMWGVDYAPSSANVPMS